MKYIYFFFAHSLKLLSEGSRLEAFAPLAIIAAIEKSVAPTNELTLLMRKFCVAAEAVCGIAGVVVVNFVTSILGEEGEQDDDEVVDEDDDDEEEDNKDVPEVGEANLFDVLMLLLLVLSRKFS